MPAIQSAHMFVHKPIPIAGAVGSQDIELLIKNSLGINCNHAVRKAISSNTSTERLTVTITLSLTATPFTKCIRSASLLELIVTLSLVLSSHKQNGAATWMQPKGPYGWRFCAFVLIHLCVQILSSRPLPIN